MVSQVIVFRLVDYASIAEIYGRFTHRNLHQQVVCEGWCIECMSHDAVVVVVSECKFLVV